MSDPSPQTRAQTFFLQSFRKNPSGPPPQKWPAPAVFKRWLKNAKFRDDLTHIRDALRFQADIHLATAAASVTKILQTSLDAAAPALADPSADTATTLVRNLKSFTDLLRLAHLRQRFTSDPVDPPPQKEKEQAPVPRKRDGYAEILEDPDRLKGYISLAVMQGSSAHEPFLAAFPDELAKAQATAEKIQQSKTHPQPQP
jgi:hypothetical protein